MSIYNANKRKEMPVEKIRIKNEYHEDIIRIIWIFKEHDYDLDYYSAYRLWYSHSDNHSAQWLILPVSDKELFDIIRDLDCFEGDKDGNDN